jgi:hypothetical protein
MLRKYKDGGEKPPNEFLSYFFREKVVSVERSVAVRIKSYAQ